MIRAGGRAGSTRPAFPFRDDQEAKINDMERAVRERAIAETYEEYAKTAVLQQLAAGRPLVRGAGPLDTPLVVVGEAPGAEEERLGAPFVGPGGQLLQRMLYEARIPWNLIYRTNVLPWRPPGNRTPYPFEIQASWSRLHGEISVISPKVVVCAGATAWSGVSRDEAGSFSDARWSWHEFEGRRVLVIPHPADILRSGKDEEEMTLTTVRCLSQCFEAA